MSRTISVELTQESDYRFVIDFSDAIPKLISDEHAPLGQGSGPSPDQLLAAAVGNCLSASLLFAIRKFRQDPGLIRTRASCTIDRNDAKRLRVLAIDVEISLGRAAGEIEHLGRAVRQFADFCTVSRSVEAGIPIRTTVRDSAGIVIEPDPA